MEIIGAYIAFVQLVHCIVQIFSWLNSKISQPAQDYLC